MKSASAGPDVHLIFIVVKFHHFRVQKPPKVSSMASDHFPMGAALEGLPVRATFPRSGTKSFSRWVRLTCTGLPPKASNLRVAATSEKRHKIILPMGAALGGLPVFIFSHSLT